jgi:hypothetical protein
LALLENPVPSANMPITSEEAQTKRKTGTWDDSAALKITLQDSIRAENFASSKAWVAGWNSAAILYQSPYSLLTWEGTSVPRSNVPFYTVATAVNSIVPQIINGLFYENPPFIVDPRPNTKKDTARAIGDLMAYQLEDIGFRESLRLGCTNACLFGTNIWKWGWESFTRKTKRYERTDKPVSVPSNVPGQSEVDIYPDEEQIDEIIYDEQVDRPFFDCITNLRHVLIDPTLDVPNIQKAKFVIHRMFVTYDDLVKMKERPGFNIPSDKELIELFMPPRELADPEPQEMSTRNPLWDLRAEPRWQDGTIDPFNEPLELLERWDKDKYIVILQKKLVICNDDNPYGAIPFFSVNWWDCPEAFFGLGLGKTIGAEQRLQQGVTNTWMDNITLNLQGAWTRKRGKTIPTQSIRIAPGRVIDVEEKDDIQPLARTPGIPEAGQMIALSQSRAEQVSGANELSSQGIAGSSGHSNIARTAAGANLLGQGSNNRNTDFVEKISNNVIIPFLYQVHEMNRALLPAKTVKQILTDELQSDYFQNKGDILEILNARLKFNILAGAKMAVRRNLAQALPVLSSFLTNQFVLQQLETEQKKIDVKELLHLFFEAAEMPDEFYSIVVPMTPDEVQRTQQNSPAALAQMKLQAAQAMQTQQMQQKESLLDQENWSKAGRDILRDAVETAGKPEAIQGQAGPAGFGGENF